MSSIQGETTVPQNPKLLADKLNECLDELGAPNNIRERSMILSKMLRIPKQQAWGLLEGQIFPDDALLDIISEELEVASEWLIK